MKILVLGATGYLGSHITRRLCQEGHTLVCTKREQSDTSRLTDIEAMIDWIPATIDSINAVSECLEFDCVINMACNYGKNVISYDSVLEANLEFPLKVLNKAVDKRIKKFITIGTGLPDELNIYSFSKKMFSDFGRFCTQKHDISFMNLKLEMFYGADEPVDRFIPSLVRKMLLGETVDTTCGVQHRDIISVKDVVEGIILVLNSTVTGYYDVSVGTGVAPTISEIVDYIWDETGKKSLVNKGAIPMRENEPDCIADVTFLENLGKWNTVHWKQGIKEMIEVVKTNMESEKA